VVHVLGTPDRPGSWESVCRTLVLYSAEELREAYERAQGSTLPLCRTCRRALRGRGDGSGAGHDRGGDGDQS
jgi:hypothetical protein